MKLKRRKKALVTSLLSLLMCVVMLASTTYAWFTDTVTSGVNTITAGNLKLGLEYLDGTEWKTVTESTKLFDEQALWEPGHTEVAYLRLSNAGNLALKYKLAVNVANEKAGTNVAGESFKLSDYIKMGVVETWDGLAEYATREAALAQVTNAGNISSYTKSGSMQKDAAPFTFAIVVYMPEGTGNEANYKAGTQAPEIEIGIKVEATQLVSEEDSFDNLYDAAAPWLGDIAEVPAPSEADGKIHIATPEQLAGFAKSVNEGNVYSGKEIVLDSDIDLNYIEWTPIACTVAVGNGFGGTFDGNNHTICNLTTKNDEYGGLFAKTCGKEIKNLNLKNVDITTHGYAGAVAARGWIDIVNCTVDGGTITSTPKLLSSGVYDDGAKVGGIIGYENDDSVGQHKVTGCTVRNLTITAYRDLGGIVGCSDKGTVTGNAVGENVKLNYVFAFPYAGSTPNQNMNEYIGRELNSPVSEENTGSVVKGEANLITSAQELVMFSNAVNSGITFAGQTVKLVNDIDMKNVVYTPAGNVTSYPSITFAGTFDGQEHTISNLTTSDKLPNYAAAGLFGSITGTVKNVKLKNVNISSTHYAGAIAGYSSEATSAIENCTVDGGTITSVPELIGDEYDNGDKVGGIIGYCVAGNKVTGCTVKNLTITAYRDLGGIVGAASAEVTGNKVEKTDIVQDNTNGYKTSVDTVGEIVGRDLGGTFKNNTSVDVTLKSK